MNVALLEVILNIPCLILIALIFASPFYINKKTSYLNFNRLVKITYLIMINAIISGFLTFVYFYWSIELSNHILLEKMGYDTNGWNEYECLKNINPKNIEKAKEILFVQEGIGWPLKAIINFIIIVLPYEIVISIILGIRSKTNIIFPKNII